MADVNTTIGPGKTYSSIDNWEDNFGGAADGDIRDQGIVTGTVYPMDDTAQVVVSGWTTDSSHYISLVADATARHAGVWDGDKYNLVFANDDVFYVGEDYVRLDGLQISSSGMNGNGDDIIYVIGQSTGANDIRLSNLIVKGAGDTTYNQNGILLNDADLVSYVWNCIVYNIGAPVSGASYCIRGVGATHCFYSCVTIGGNYGIACSSSAVVTAKNCYSGGSLTEDISYGTGTFAKTNCASEDASADDAGGTETQTNCITGVALDTDTFVNITAGTENFHLAADGLSPLEDTGVDTSGDAAPLNFTTDIDGDTITTYPIGADFRYVAVPSGYINELCLVFES